MQIFNRAVVCGALALAASQASASAQTGGAANMVDHVHLGVPDQAKGVEWYHKYFGGETMAEGPERLMFGQTRLIFQKTEAPKPSTGSVLDHIGFSVADLDAAMRTYQAEGVKIVQPARDVAGLFKLGFIEDPWGTRIEVVQDPQKLGLHHVHLRAPDPAAALGWYVDKFSGTVAKLKGRVDGINFGGVWILAASGDATPSQGHAIDHIGFRPLDVDSFVAGLKTKNVKVTTEPRPLTLPSGTTMRLAFIEGPDGVRIELVQR